jgi:hypothetical protein
MSSRTSEHLKRFIDLHRRGPVQVRHQILGVSRVMHTVSDSAAARARSSASPSSSPPRPAADRHQPAEAPAPESDAAERRGRDRHAYDNRVVALVDEAARVFIGRDISTGGMRVDTHPELGIGFRVKLALHAGPRSEPILVDAIVDRDDGEDGVFLRFQNVSESLEREIDQVMRRLDVTSTDAESGGLIVSELLSVEASHG